MKKSEKEMPQVTKDTVTAENAIATADLEKELEEIHDLIDDKKFEIHSFSQQITEYSQSLSEAEDRLLENLLEMHELKHKKVKIETLIAKLTDKLEAINAFIGQIDSDLYYDKSDVKYAQSGIAFLENLIADRGVEIYELSEKAEAIEAEILNRKMIEAMTESLMTAEAFNASIQAEETAAIMALEVKISTFEIERFSEDDAWIPEEVTAAEDPAEKEVPVVDEETKLRGEYAELSSEIDTLEDKLIELKGRRFEVGTKLSDVVRSKIEETFQKAKEAIKKAAKVGASIELRVANREGYYWIEGGEEWEMLYCSVGYDGDVIVEIGDKEVVRYKDKWEGTAAIEGLIAAIERGDEIYTFPADK